MSDPLVSCLMPTANRRTWVPLAIATFLAQDFASRELVILDDGHDPVGDLVPRDPRIRYLRVAGGQSLGAKRNQACRLARGEILVNWDDDDWSAPWRLTYQVGELNAHAADVCGLDRLWFFDPERELAWRYRYPPSRMPWVAGSTQCYRRSIWEKYPFPDVTVGEDNVWIAGVIGARVLPLARDDFFVASIHGANTSPRETDGTRWTRADPARVRALVGFDVTGFRPRPAPSPPLVSCILPTGGRRAFVALSLERFVAQDYLRKELVVVDDGPEPVDDLFAGVPNVRYLRMPPGRTVGEKRNEGCAAASGDVLLQWDDDDWFGAARLSRQVAPLADGRADVTALETRWIARLPEGEFWGLSPALHRRMFYGDVHAGTLAFRRDLWTDGVRYPDQSLAEDAQFLHDALARGGRLLRVANEELFIYIRHGRNAWTFDVGRHLNAREWGRLEPPDAFGPVALSRYRDAAAALPTATA
jgi:glycosyltransferase involved in cell wall biosynthesis